MSPRKLGQITSTVDHKSKRPRYIPKTSIPIFVTTPMGGMYLNNSIIAMPITDRI